LPVTVLDTTAPNALANGTARVSGISATVRWAASTDVGVTVYGVTRWTGTSSAPTVT